MNPDNVKNIPILVCKSRITGKTNYIESGESKCRKQFYYFGKLVPTFDCGNNLNIHECFLLSKNDLKNIKIESAHD